MVPRRLLSTDRCRKGRQAWSFRQATLTGALALTAAGCQSARPAGGDAAAIRSALPGARAASTTTVAAGEWMPLIVGETLNGWHNYATPSAPATGWTVTDGQLIRTGPGGDLTTNRMYGNFELELEWQVDAGGNSGIIYRIDHAAEKSYLSGPEMQILDDARHADGKNPLTTAGSNYALHGAATGHVKPAGEWNAVRLIVRGAEVEHWLNGVPVVRYTLGSPEWEAKRQASKFANSPLYGRASRGHIALQDHGDRVTFRNIRLRELP